MLRFDTNYCFKKVIFESNKWLIILSRTSLKGFKTTISSHVIWQNEIGNAFKYSYSNGYIEGANQKIKLVKNKTFRFENENRNRKLMQLTIDTEK